ncbi:MULTISPECIES: DUF3108 domain-containing protein [unclassified Pseudoalteromonas]|uniref:DUF3108 domain-containing protein n=1 Tax=unclassified Pseudoalteromonas TaxID=194690 RepID=UPI001EEF8CBC|nr:DUF3108 domain-containing protein [Pseudoalteromonas sp. L21]MCF7516660.1 DUF3108 domain-containing protein [Pseudoalteromonas sp. L21]UJX24379.1 DUF3108 domain-containing protein [Pseudoalteromonas sp. CF6-2]
MQFLTKRNFLHTAHITQNKKRSALLACVGTLLLPTSVLAGDLTQYQAKYDVLRKGETHGKAVRELKKINDGNYVLTYHSEIEWMIFSDSRKETSEFSYQDHKISPLSYAMERTGTGPDKEYTLKFDPVHKQVNSNQSKYPLKFDWSDDFQDSLSYQVQVREELKQGKTQLSYPLVDKKGNLRSYDFEVIGTEMISLPIGNIDAIKVKRLYDNNKRQALAWFAPEMDYMLVRMWKGEKGVEQFEVQLNSFTVTTPVTVANDK